MGKGFVGQEINKYIKTYFIPYVFMPVFTVLYSLFSLMIPTVHIDLLIISYWMSNIG